MAPSWAHVIAPAVPTAKVKIAVKKQISLERRAMGRIAEDPITISPASGESPSNGPNNKPLAQGHLSKSSDEGGGGVGYFYCKPSTGSF